MLLLRLTAQTPNAALLFQHCFTRKSIHCTSLLHRRTTAAAAVSLTLPASSSARPSPASFTLAAAAVRHYHISRPSSSSVQSKNADSQSAAQSAAAQSSSSSSRESVNDPILYMWRPPSPLYILYIRLKRQLLMTQRGRMVLAFVVGVTVLYMVEHPGRFDFNFVKLKPDVWSDKTRKPMFSDPAPMPFPGDEEAMLKFIERERNFTHVSSREGSGDHTMAKESQEDWERTVRDIAQHMVAVGAYNSIEGALGDKGWNNKQSSVVNSSS
ncbi:hypothetical protein CAOG_07160 [Capsaspora owczarzaki ATCC 30864]|uniref:Uncharacterized protein n=1 Tax=Capsaspora owczarzaki (strain ATCC 30864) TaxID=595528 RepID=A0A0D2VYT3_CAPO3|nr:hypothetical protein CAOG_07160 [Capsaspora owczarzaki ATCC 30864]KJE96912.1 hypothetical protein CAOG_007160 [Capsaspora owczarzaki ATCC 30864]|eukprot:XP_004343884.1 hypothetical protein CAOG_07160 [Capsaspora owczarzaki ATCC 30864]